MITVKQIMKWKPCPEYPKKRVIELIGDGKTPLEICDLNIPSEDRLWVLLRLEIIPELKLHELACDFAQAVAHLNPDPRVQAVIDAKRKWIKGEITNEELAAARAAALAARDAAWDAALAAGDAARVAAWVAAGVAAGYAAGVAACDARDAALAAWDAARDAARDDAWVAAGVAAWDARDAAEVAALAEQLNMVKKVLQEL